MSNGVDMVCEVQKNKNACRRRGLARQVLFGIHTTKVWRWRDREHCKSVLYCTYRDRNAKWLLVTKLKASNTPALMRVLSESKGTNSAVTMQMPPQICGRGKKFQGDHSKG